jgi:FGGY-family pentulose kinase
MTNPAVIGVDVGTGSARAGIFDLAGRKLAQASHQIVTWKEGADFVEQSSDDIWRAVCTAVRSAIKLQNEPTIIQAVGFTATCSLVALDGFGKPIAVNHHGDSRRNIIVWMDHRARAQTDRINRTGAEILRYLGGRISLEMQMPKLLWIKDELPKTWTTAEHFFDLPDFLTWRATGSLTRSICSLVCKWTYLGKESRWDADFLRSIGLGELVHEDYRRIGKVVRGLGDTAGLLSAQAAEELGLPAGIPVGVSAIDAHAGGIGLLGASLQQGETIEFDRRLALIGGTSSCHMAINQQPKFVPGVWGPYFSALLPGYWLNEGGQSATGALIDHVINASAVGRAWTDDARNAGSDVYSMLNQALSASVVTSAIPAAMTHDLHVFPDFHGNRSPRADASLQGMISGLKLSDTKEDLARLYLATIQAIAYGTRHIVETMNKHGFAIDTLFACGGGSKNPVFLREHADALGMPIVLNEEEEAVLLGAAILGAVAAGRHPDLPSAMAKMSRPARIINPTRGRVHSYHSNKYAVFRRLYDDQLAYRELMSSAPLVDEVFV